MRLLFYILLAGAFPEGDASASAAVCRPPPRDVYVEFQPGTAVVRSQDWLDAVVGLTGPLPLPASGTIEIIGRASPAGDAEREFDLSKRRAQLVASAFKSSGIEDDVLIVTWQGASVTRVGDSDATQVNFNYNRPVSCRRPSTP